jgi:hypothetical protein
LARRTPGGLRLNRSGEGIAASTLLAACFVFMWLVGLYEMWLSTTPDAAQERERAGL